jgi:hypothetical protein
LNTVDHRDDRARFDREREIGDGGEAAELLRDAGELKQRHYDGAPV